jgi:outer membrane protein OmpA-like peptidoglycan-associated protein
MFNSRAVMPRRVRTDAEAPFWISFADLMTALMVLFLVVMGVALLAVTKTVTERDQAQQQHRDDVARVVQRFADAARRYDGIRVDSQRHVIDFGDRARFAFGSSALAPQQQQVLRQFVPEMLALANDELGRRVLKRMVVEGYTDATGTYLANLNLSLQRSQRVLCAMFASDGANPLSDDQKQDVRRLFVVGGYSYNDAKASDEQSRRVEMRLEFLEPGMRRDTPAADSTDVGECALR